MPTLNSENGAESPLSPFGIELSIAHADTLAELPVKELVFRHRLVLVRGIDVLPSGTFLNLVATWAGGLDQLLRWSFGYLLEVKEDPDKENYLFSNEAVPLHWDGAFHTVPRILAFQCRDTEGVGGETTFCDTTKVWNAASSSEKREWSQLSLSLCTDKKAHYGGKRCLNLVGTHIVTKETVLRFAEPVVTQRNPVEVSIDGASSRDWLVELPKRLYSPSACYSHRWRIGDIVLCDNLALVHGRQAFAPGTRRCLQRVQIL